MLNKSMLTGNLTKAPYQTDSERAMITLAVSKDYKVEDGKPTADFIPVSLKGSNATNALKHLTTGDNITIVGRLASYIPTDGDFSKLIVNAEKVYYNKVKAWEDTDGEGIEEAPQDAPGEDGE